MSTSSKGGPDGEATAEAQPADAADAAAAEEVTAGLDQSVTPSEPPADTGTPAPSTAPRGLRSLSDVLGGGSLAASLAAAQAQVAPSAPDGLTDEDLAALFGGGPLPSPSSAAAAGQPEPASSSAAASQPPEAKVHPADKLLHPKYGYAALGGVLPSDAASSSAALSLESLLRAQQPRVHPRRVFMPGQTYDPADLNAYADPAASGPAGRQRRPQWRTMPSAAEVRQYADYKNAAFLEKFLSPAGRLLSRRKTKLPHHEHRTVVKQIKTARAMGFLAHEARLEKADLRHVRERELREAQERGLL